MDQGGESVSGIKNSDLFGDEDDEPLGSPTNLFTLLTGFAVVGIVISLFGRTPDVTLLTGIIVFTLSSVLVSDMIFIANYLMGIGDDWMRVVILTLFAPLILGFLLVMINYWRGVDS